MKTYYRYFGGMLERQQEWLNQIAQQGYRLVSVNQISYTFEETNVPYEYAITFIAHESYSKGKDYKTFLEEMGYRTFYKNMNLGVSIGKASWRPYGKGKGQIATSPGSYYKELLIVEKKKDTKPFELYTSNSDQANYYKPLRNMWLTLVVLMLGLSVWQWISIGTSITVWLGFTMMCVALLVSLQYQRKITYYKKQANMEE